MKGYPQQTTERVKMCLKKLGTKASDGENNPKTTEISSSDW